MPPGPRFTKGWVTYWQSCWFRGECVFFWFGGECHPGLGANVTPIPIWNDFGAGMPSVSRYNDESFTKCGPVRANCFKRICWQQVFVVQQPCFIVFIINVFFWVLWFDGECRGLFLQVSTVNCTNVIRNTFDLLRLAVGAPAGFDWLPVWNNILRVWNQTCDSW